ncbi:MAG: nucleoside-diphosphate kinase [candidate division Zixibacteria bacterium HGW-Zixibacteria-1]|nr:MAG: nucleoside-diphosphate kinase [candidate division Zixibacteria bacterium HGW-Zixibacteria-1]
MANTLGIIKPDGVRRKLVGKIISKIEGAGLIIRGMKVLKIDREQAERFYAVHESRPFYKSLVEFMTSGPVVVMVIGGHGAIEHWRDLMGATDPAKAKYNTIRREYGTSIEKNVVHGSDGEATAKIEVAFFFDQDEILPKGV